MTSADVLISAPVKIILFGEHLVTYGKIAVTTAADLRATCYIRLRPQPGVSLSGGGHSYLGLLLDTFHENIEEPSVAERGVG